MSEHEKMYEKKYLINLDEEMMRLREIQATLGMSEKAVEEAFRIFIYACGLQLCKSKTPVHLMSTSVHIAAKRSAAPIALIQISRTFGIPKADIYDLSKKIMVRLLSEIESLTIKKEENLMSMLLQKNNRNDVNVSKLGSI